MLFPTFSFLFFFLAVFIGYWYVCHSPRSRSWFLIIISYIFYGLWGWRFCFFLFASSAINYVFAYLVSDEKVKLQKLFLVLSVIFNVCVLGFFKYYNFFADSLNQLFLSLGLSAELIFPSLQILLPIGISFYTFKGMSLIFDAHSGDILAFPSFSQVLLYISFFPQVASGPIVHASDFFPSLEGTLASGTPSGAIIDKAGSTEARYHVSFNTIDFSSASALIMSGLLKKMVFATYLSTLLVDPVFADPSSFSTLEVVLAAIGYSSVIYCDFSGYSDMAIGIALLLGFKTPKNFDRPYISFSITEFWKRWHISFSSWLRKYVYFAMGGSRHGLPRTLLGLTVTMLVSGIWHGASWMFILWGGMQAVAMVFERIYNIGKNPSEKKFLAFLQIIATFIFTTISWVVFRSETFTDVKNWFIALGNFSVNSTLISPLIILILVVSLCFHFIPTKVREESLSLWYKTPVLAKSVLIAVFLVLLSVFSMSGVAPFIYFSF